MRWLLTAALLLLTLFGALLIGVAITGRDRRAYPVLPPEAIVTVAGQRFTVAELAARYQPRFYLRPDTPSPPLLWVWYEAVLNNAGVISLVYYQTWETEVNPNPTIQKLYSVFRAAYYGYPLYDIEYFQVDVALADSTVTRLRFETGATDDFFMVLSDHIIVILDRQPDGQYWERRTTRAGDLMAERPDVPVQFDQTRARIGVQTWNHLSKLLTPLDTAYTVALEAPLQPLTDADYAGYKFVRKSQGDHRTTESRWMLPLASAAVFAFVALPVWGVYLLRHSRKAKSAKPSRG